MAKHKTLQSVVNNFTHSFTSLMDYRHDDYVMGHILTAARETSKSTLKVDLLTGHIEPEEFLRGPIVESVADYCVDFPGLVTRSGSDPSFVKAAQMTISFGISVEQPVLHAPHLNQSPFVCTVSITDDRGRIYQRVRRDWWYPEEIHRVKSRFLPTPPIQDRPRLASRLVRFFRRR